VNPSKAKGTRWESAIVDFLRGRGIEARRAVQNGRLDDGDIHGIGPFVGQAKAYRDLATGLRLGTAGAERQKDEAGERWGVLFLKAPRRPVSEAYAVMRMETFAEVLEALREAQSGSQGCCGREEYPVPHGFLDAADSGRGECFYCTNPPDHPWHA
jgi:hypothetical protein